MATGPTEVYEFRKTFCRVTSTWLPLTDRVPAQPVASTTTVELV